MPDHEKKLIVPNANLKLTMTYANGIVADIARRTFCQPQHHLSLTGLVDSPVNLNPLHDTKTATIIFEFNPAGAYRFLRLNYAQIKNQITDLSAIIGTPVLRLNEQLAESMEVEKRVTILQNFLLTLLENESEDQIYNYCVTRIEATHGLVSVKQLEKETGYSARWLHEKFKERIGTGPKNLAEIIRFRQFYMQFASNESSDFFKGRIQHLTF